MEAQLEYVRTHCMHVFARLALICVLSRVLTNKISASELSRKFIKGALLVGQEKFRATKGRWMVSR